MNGPAAIVVVNYGSSGLLHNLERTSKEMPQGTVVVVVDNRTTDEERATVRALAGTRGWEVVTPGSNLGFGGGMAVGVERARACGAAAVVLLNPDAEVTARDLLLLLDEVGRDPEALVAPRVLRPDGTVWSAGIDLDTSDGRMKRIADWATPSPEGRRRWLSGACLALSIALWDTVGGFADDYFLYWEDVELSHRVVASGGRLVLRADAVAVHAEGGTQRAGLRTAGEPKSATYYYFNTRNRLVYATRMLPDEAVRRWRRQAWPVAKDVLLQGGRRQLLRPWTPVRAVVRGTVAGLRLSRHELRERAQGRGRLLRT